MRSPARSLLPLALLGALGCNSAIDISVGRGPVALHFSDVGCAVSYAGDRGAGPSAIDITCPANLRPRGDAPSLHISTPLVTAPGPLDLRDEHFRKPGYQLGQFVVVTYEAEGRSVTCDPLQARGTIVYSEVPKAGAPGRISGQFSDDAALLNCYTGAGSDGNIPLALTGSFNLEAPAR